MSSVATALAGLARIKSPEAQGQLALGVTEICTEKPLAENAIPIADDILVSLARKVEEDIRIAMANRLADCEWAPNGVVRHLAFDSPSVAEAVIARSPALTEADLVALTSAGSVDHRKMIASRRKIGIPVTDALVSHNETPVIDRLIENQSAALSGNGMAACHKRAKSSTDLADVFVKRTDIPEAILHDLAYYVSAAVREQVEKRFDADRETLADLTHDAVMDALTEDDEQQAAELVEKLSDQGKLDPGSTMRALTEGRFILFDHSIAHLSGVKVDDWRAALALSSMRAAALACRAARIDKSLFPSVVRGLQKAGRIQDELPPEAMVTAAKAFQAHTPGQAHDALRRLARTV